MLLIQINMILKIEIEIIDMNDYKTIHHNHHATQ